VDFLVGQSAHNDAEPIERHLSFSVDGHRSPPGIDAGAEAPGAAFHQQTRPLIEQIRRCLAAQMLVAPCCKVFACPDEADRTGGSISADYANYRAHSVKPARAPAVTETRRRRGWAAGASRYPLPDRRKPGVAWRHQGTLWPNVARSFSNFSTAGTSHKLEVDFDRRAGR